MPSHAHHHAHTDLRRHIALAVEKRSLSSLSDALVPRDSDETAPPPDTEDGSESMINLMLIVLGGVFVALLLVSLLFLFRRARRQREMRAGLGADAEALPSYYEKSAAALHNGGNAGYRKNHGLTIETKHNGRSSILVIGRDGNPMLANPNSPPHSPDNVPEIHITFPDEQDEQGRPKSGRVLVVRVGDNATIGLEPVHDDEQLPAYEKEAKSQFYSLDMDSIGGLKEKDQDRHLFQ